MKRSQLWSGALAAIALSGATLLATEARILDDQQTIPKAAAHGSYLFKTYCASCHGTSARGDGPLASALTRKPANLTEIAKRAKGEYPSELVFRIIDGRTKVAGHGGPDMPVWGDAFMRSRENMDEAAVRDRIQALVDYLETIQAREAQN
jgi:mono/diheme cytochrome c family protein